MNKDTLNSFSKRVKGEFYPDQLHRLIYATDASAYREEPVGILVAKDVNDVKEAIAFARENKLSIIPVQRVLRLPDRWLARVWLWIVRNT